MKWVYAMFVTALAALVLLGLAALRLAPPVGRALAAPAEFVGQAIVWVLQTAFGLAVPPDWGPGLGWFAVLSFIGLLLTRRTFRQGVILFMVLLGLLSVLLYLMYRTQLGP